MVLKASDATSNTISLSCKVEAGNDYDRIESGGPPGLTLQLNNNVQTNVTITGPLTASGTGYRHIWCRTAGTVYHGAQAPHDRRTYAYVEDGS